MNVEFLTQKVHYKVEGDEKRLILLMSFMAKNIYNCALYELRQWYFKSKGKSLKLETLINRASNNESYTYLGKERSDYIITDLHKAFNKYIKFHNFDGTLKEECGRLSEGKDFAKMPRYLPKDGYHSFRSKGIKRDVNNEYVILPLPEKIKDGSIFENKLNDKQLNSYVSSLGIIDIADIKIKLTKNILNQTIRIIDITPGVFGEVIYASLVYPLNSPALKPQQDDKILGIDLGVNNLMACATTSGAGFIIDGRELKSQIRLYNNKIAHFQSRLPILEDGTQKKKTYNLKKLQERANNKINDYLDKAVAVFFKEIAKYDIRTIVIGWNVDFKEEVAKNPGDSQDLSRTKNRIILKTPLAKIRNKIINKGKRLGITVELVNEANTSKKSFYDNDRMDDNSFSGEREKRGKYVTSNGKTMVNADINAALNIICKYELKRKKPIEELNKIRANKPIIPKIIHVPVY